MLVFQQQLNLINHFKILLKWYSNDITSKPMTLNNETILIQDLELFVTL